MAVGSGKGGVGKSTVAVNLSAALSAAGHRVGLLDADIWGFFVPHMLGATGKPTVVGDPIMPIEAHGLAVLSIGNFLPEDAPVVWRGPCCTRRSNRFSPMCIGTTGLPRHRHAAGNRRRGDFRVPVAAGRELPAGHDTARHRTAGSPVGRPDGREGRAPDQRCGREHGELPLRRMRPRADLFGAGAGEQLAETLDVPLLARIPLDPAVPRPAVPADPDVALAQRFVDLAARVAGQPSRVRRSLPLLT